MSDLHVSKLNVRKSFGKIKDLVSVPDLIAIQSSSFNDFIQLDFLPEERKSIGLEKVFRDTFPINYEDKLSLEFVSYELGNWACNCGELTGIANRYHWQCSSCKTSDYSRLNEQFQCPKCKKKTARYITCPHCLSRVVIQMPMTLEEARSSGQTFSMPLKVKIQLISWAQDETGKEPGKKVIRDVKEQAIRGQHGDHLHHLRLSFRVFLKILTGRELRNVLQQRLGDRPHAVVAAGRVPGDQHVHVHARHHESGHPATS